MRDSARKKPYTIVGMDPRSEALVMHTASKIKAKLSGVIHRMKPLERSGSIRENQHW